MFSRRRFLEASLFAGASSVMAARLALANAPTDSRFVFVLLRGALDDWSAVPAVGDPAYAPCATDRAADRATTALPLDGTFGLHPALVPAAELREGAHGVARDSLATASSHSTDRTFSRMVASCRMASRVADQSGHQRAARGVRERRARRECAAGDARSRRSGVPVANAYCGAGR